MNNWSCLTVVDPRLIWKDVTYTFDAQTLCMLMLLAQQLKWSKNSLDNVFSIQFGICCEAPDVFFGLFFSSMKLNLTFHLHVGE